jgi:hypothetical protein
LAAPLLTPSGRSGRPQFEPHRPINKSRLIIAARK